MKANKIIVDNVEQMMFDLFHLSTEGFFDNDLLCRIYKEKFNAVINARTLRAALQELRNAGRVRCLVAGSYGYKFAENTEEIVIYLKRLQKEATQLHRLYSSIKKQAETDFGEMLEIPFVDEQ